MAAFVVESFGNSVACDAVEAPWARPQQTSAAPQVSLSRALIEERLAQLATVVAAELTRVQQERALLEAPQDRDEPARRG